MDKKEFFKQRIDKIAKESFNNDQKEIAKKIIEQTTESDLDAVWGLISQRVKTGFVFDEAPEINHNCIAYIKENEKLGVNLENKNALEHALIIGENYDALKNLVALYTDKQGKGLIDVIYIDPPYNTDSSKKDGNDYKEEIEGKNKFIYRDKYTRDGWLNMMNERLKLAKRLLSDSGVIFISIDDSEQAYLKVLCDEIFGEENFISTLHWKKKKQPSFLHGQVARVMEYILIYSKDKTNVGKLSLESPSDQNTRVDNATNEISIRKINKGIKVKLDKGISVIHKGLYRNKSMETEFLDDVFIENGRTTNDFYAKARFRDSQERINMFCENDVLFITKNFGFRRDKLPEELSKRKQITDLLLDWGDNQDSDDEIKQLFENKIFEYPKPVLLIKKLIKSVDLNSDITILDFFAGSGTTGQAVMELNEEDCGNRKFILVTNNENNIAKDITRERLYRVIKGKGSKGENFEWVYSKDKKNLENNSLRVFEIVKQELNITEVDTAEKIKEDVETNFVKLKSDYTKNDNLNIYNVLSSLTPYKNDSED